MNIIYNFFRRFIIFTFLMSLGVIVYLTIQDDDQSDSYFASQDSKDYSFPLKFNYTITSNYGKRKDPFSNLVKHHNGLDLACPQNTPIFSVKNGIVFDIGYDDIYGNYIKIKHNDVYSFYAHLSKTTVKIGQSVERGQKIALSGNSGKSTGPHLHFEIQKFDTKSEKFISQNPKNFIDVD